VSQSILNSTRTRLTYGLNESDLIQFTFEKTKFFST